MNSLIIKSKQQLHVMALICTILFSCLFEIQNKIKALIKISFESEYPQDPHHNVQEKNLLNRKLEGNHYKVHAIILEKAQKLNLVEIHGLELSNRTNNSIPTQGSLHCSGIQHNTSTIGHLRSQHTINNIFLMLTLLLFHYWGIGYLF